MPRTKSKSTTGQLKLQKLKKGLFAICFLFKIKDKLY